MDALEPLVPVVQLAAAVLLGGVAALAVIGGLLKVPLIGGLLRWLWRTVVVTPLEAWHGDRIAQHTEPLVASVARLDERLCAFAAETRAELTTNGGKSLKDAARRSASGVRRVERRIGRIEDQLASHVATHERGDSPKR